MSIFGECNSGKSYLLNQLLKVPDAFEVHKESTLKQLIQSSPRIEKSEPTSSHTRGLWMFADPITIEKEGDIFDIFFIDSEGLLPPPQPTEEISPISDNSNQEMQRRARQIE